MAIMVSNVNSGLMEEIQQAWQEDPNMQAIIRELLINPSSHPHFSWQSAQLRRKGRLVVGHNPSLKQKILSWLHNSAIGGHSGVEATMRRVKTLFYWSGIKREVAAYIKHCSVCQQCKYDHNASPGLLQPLPIPERVWEEITMDFIEGLPNSLGKTVTVVVVDRLSKYAHFLPLSHPFTAVKVAQAYMDHVFKLHGSPKSIISDRDKIFVSSFWSELMKLQGVHHKLSTAYHPQTDGQTKVLNRCLESYLRCMCTDTPREWARWLALAEYWYNTTYHSATDVTPYEVVYGQPPPTHTPYLAGSTAVDSVDRSL